MFQWQKFLLSLGLGVSIVALPLTAATPAWAAQKTTISKSKTTAKKVDKVVKVTQKNTSAKAASVKGNVKQKVAKTKSANKVAARKATKGGKQVASTTKAARAAKWKKQQRVARRAIRRGPSQATLAGLRQTDDPLDLGSSVAYIVDQDTGEELFTKNADVPLPIASVTKLMTALVIAESGVPMNKSVKITKEDYLRSSASSKLRNGMVMPRSELLKAALMSSDNRAAHALARTTPQGKAWFIKQMNLTAKRLGMEDTFFADPTGLDNRNHSTARDLAKLVAAAYEYKDIREASTMSAAQLRAGRYVLNLHTTNRLIGNPDWNIGIQKTGFTTAAGRCMVVQSEVGSRRVVMVVLDSPNNTQRAADMTSMKQFVEAENRIDRQFSTALPYEIF